MNPHDVSADGSESFTSSASSSRTGVLKSSMAGSAATTPLTNSVTGKRERYRNAHQPTARIGIHALSRVNPNRAIAPIQSGNHLKPRSKARIAAANAPISSVSPQLSVSGTQEQETEQRKDRSDIARERDVEQRTIAGDVVEGGAGQRKREPALVEGLVVLGPRSVAGVVRIPGAQLRREGPLERPRERSVVVDPSELEELHLVVQPVGRPRHRILKCRPDRETRERREQRGERRDQWDAGAHEVAAPLR